MKAQPDEILDANICLAYNDGLSWKQIADSNHVSKEYVRNVIKESAHSAFLDRRTFSYEWEQTCQRIRLAAGWDQRKEG